MDRYDFRTASADSLFAAKVEWAKKLAKALEDHVDSGGWRSYHLKTETSLGGARGADMSGDAEEYGFSIYANIDMEMSVVHASFSVHRRETGEALNPLEFLTRGLERDDLPIDDRASMKDVVMMVSLWWSKFVNKIPRK